MNEPDYRTGTFELGRYSDDLFRLRVEDKASGRTVFEAYIDPASLALAMGGRGAMPIRFCETRPGVAPLVGLTRSVRTVFIDRERLPEAPGYRSKNSDDPEQLAKIEAFREAALVAALYLCKAADGDDYLDGWLLNDDGLRSQQNEPGKHRVSLERYDADVPAQVVDGIWKGKPSQARPSDNPSRSRRR